ncbi:MAG TPA: amidohydrolase family protein [Pyrinomonadaceae bacterium]|nr:amidohydrolase family protein [Pyrinomonadaceae bacterium]
MCLVHQIGGAFTRKPEELKDFISSRAGDVIKRAFDDIDPQKLVDHHTHVAGLGTEGTYAFVNPKMRTWAHPFHHLKFKVYLSAAGVEDIERADIELIQRLTSLISHIDSHGKHRILAFDKNYRPDGSINLEKTEFYVSNEYVFELAARYPDLFVPNISVNPYRPDALEELEKWAQRGARIVKWLPNAMGIDPSNERCDPFYQKMKELDLVLLSHGGEEKAVEAEEDQKLGNPLLLRRALDHGVKVIVAHCAGLGDNEDLDSKDGKRAPNFDLFMRLMDDKRYEGLVFGEVSAMTQFNRIGRPLTTVLKREDLHERLLNGSDYPLPAINVLIRTRPLVKNGYINSDERLALNEIYDYNPLLFDFVLKRTIKLPGTEKRLPASVFMTNPALGL